MLRKILRYFLIILFSFLSLIVLLVALSITPLNDTPYRQLAIYNEMQQRIEHVKNNTIKKPSAGFSVGYARVNLTPSHPTATAGYGNRRGKLFTEVHDSIYVNAIVITNGSHRVALVSADLLIIPPTVTDLLKDKLPDIGFDLNNTYLSATHTHNSIGNWGEGLTRFIYGTYKDSIVHFIADRIKKSIELATRNIRPATLKAGSIPLAEAVKNRLVDDGPVDSLMRVIEVIRDDSTKLIAVSYTAHATCLFSKDLSLSRDYPGALVDSLEKKGYDFAMFMAGAVASHKSKSPESGLPCVAWMAQRMTEKLLTHRSQLHTILDSTLMMVNVPLLLREPQVKITNNWKIRPTLFNKAFGEYTPFITALRIGDLVLLGTPCDYSGELALRLDPIAAKHGMKAMVTSFNGGYIGYITPDPYYEIDHYETHLMNWYGPTSGSYLSECLLALLESVGETSIQSP